MSTKTKKIKKQANDISKLQMGIGDWGLGDWGLGIGPNPQSPIPNPQSPIPNPQLLGFVFNIY